MWRLLAKAGVKKTHRPFCFALIGSLLEVHTSIIDLLIIRQGSDLKELGKELIHPLAMN